jgi:hypothetical protein
MDVTANQPASQPYMIRDTRAPKAGTTAVSTTLSLAVPGVDIPQLVRFLYGVRYCKVGPASSAQCRSSWSGTQS